MGLLNCVDYNRNRAFAELKEFCGFEYYGRKHLENSLTAFVQPHWLPKNSARTNGCPIYPARSFQGR